jgi:hypothetical protein
MDSSFQTAISSLDAILHTVVQHVGNGTRRPSRCHLAAPGVQTALSIAVKVDSETETDVVKTPEICVEAVV